MNIIIWSLVLTVCAPNGQCFNQTVQWFDKENECLHYKQIYEDIPKGSWASVNMGIVAGNGVQHCILDKLIEHEGMVLEVWDMICITQLYYSIKRQRYY